MNFYGYLICRQQIPSHSYILHHFFLPPSPLPPFLSSPSPCLPSLSPTLASHPLPYFSFSFLLPPFFLPPAFLYSLISSFHSFLFLPCLLSVPSLSSPLLISTFPFFSSLLLPLSLSPHFFPHPPLLPSSLHPFPPSFPPPPYSFHFYLSTYSIVFFYTMDNPA